MASCESYISSPDINGNCQRLSFDGFFSKDGKNFKTYTGQIFTYNKNKYADPRHEMMCTAKFPTSSQGGKQWALEEISRSESVRKIANDFNQIHSKNGPQINITCVQYASLESVGILCSRRVGEYVVFEKKLPNFTHFIDIDGQNVKKKLRRSSKRKSSKYSRSHSRESETDSCHSPQHSCQQTSIEFTTPALIPSCPPCESDDPPSYDEIYGPAVYTCDMLEADFRNFNCTNYYPVFMNNYSVYNSNVTSCLKDCPDNLRCEVVHTGIEISNWDYDKPDKLPHPLLRAFIHFYFYHAQGQRVISNLKGTLPYEDKYTLTTPTIHSLNRTCGKRDKGEEGIQRVIDNHVCSRWCRHLPSMSDIFNETRSLTRNENHHRHS